MLYIKAKYQPEPHVRKFFSGVHVIVSKAHSLATITTPPPSLHVLI